MSPTVHFSNWSSHRTPGHHGPGRKLTIMARPRTWEHGAGRVPDLTPAKADLDAVAAGRIDMVEYRRRLEKRWAAGLYALSPIQLTAYTPEGIDLVRDGDTLCCSCSRDAVAAGRCHRVWAAYALSRAGWSVVLDGRKLPTVRVGWTVPEPPEPHMRAGVRLNDRPSSADEAGDLRWITSWIGDDDRLYDPPDWPFEDGDNATADDLREAGFTVLPVPPRSPRC